MSAETPERTHALAMPPDDWPPEVHIAQLRKLWGITQRAIRRWAEVGMLPGRQDTPDGPYWFGRDDIAAFARAAIAVRECRPGMHIRYAHWVGGRPWRLVEVSLFNGIHWQLGGRTDDGALAYAPPCPGGRIVLLVPPEDLP